MKGVFIQKKLPKLTWKLTYHFRHIPWTKSTKVGRWHYTLPETNSSPLKIGLPNRKVVFQPSIFRSKLLVSGGIFLLNTWSPVFRWHDRPSFSPAQVEQSPKNKRKPRKMKERLVGVPHEHVRTDGSKKQIPLKYVPGFQRLLMTWIIRKLACCKFVNTCFLLLIMMGCFLASWEGSTIG